MAVLQLPEGFIYTGTVYNFVDFGFNCDLRRLLCIVFAGNFCLMHTAGRTERDPGLFFPLIGKVGISNRIN